MDKGLLCADSRLPSLIADGVSALLVACVELSAAVWNRLSGAERVLKGYSRAAQRLIWQKRDP